MTQRASPVSCTLYDTRAGTIQVPSSSNTWFLTSSGAPMVAEPCGALKSHNSKVTEQ